MELKEQNNEIVVGLDIGTTKIAAFVGRKDQYGKIEILGMGKCRSMGVTRGIVSNIEKTVQSISIAIDKAEQKSGTEIEVVNVGIAGQHIRSMQNSSMRTRKNIEDEINQDDIDALIDDMYNLAIPPGEEIIDVIPQEYVVDNEQGIKDPKGMAGNRIEGFFHIITGQMPAIRNIYKCVQKSGLQVNDLILEPIASAEAVLSEEEKEAGVALVDIGGGTTDIAIFHEGIIRHTAVIPFGGNAITDDLKTGCMILREQAETLKIKFGSALPSESNKIVVVKVPGLKGRAPKEISVNRVAGIIQARMEEIIEHIAFEINRSGLAKKLIAGIVLTGGGSCLRHITQLFEYITGMDTRVAFPSEHLASKTSQEFANPMYSTGIGLVIKGFQELEQKRIKEERNRISNKRENIKKNWLDKIKNFFEDV